MLTARSFARLISFQQIRQLNITRGMASSRTSDQKLTKQDLKVNHSLETKQFFIELDPPDKAVLDYDFLSDGSVDMQHTGVPNAYRGQGIAAVLAKVAFSHFTTEQTKMLVSCTYLQKYYKDHPDSSTPDLITIPS